MKKFLYIIFFIYIIGVIYLTFFYDVILVPRENFKILDTVNLIPFMVIYDNISLIERGIWFQAFKQTFGNFILLIPAGLLVPLIWENIKFDYKKALKIGFLITFSIETLQLFISFILQNHYKSFDIDDLILNTVGFTLGFFFYNLFKKFFKK